jgi:undecaprenyl-diphosphatase
VAERRNDICCAAVAAVVLVVTSIVAAHTLPAWERHLFEVINSRNGIIAAVLWLPMQFGAAFAPPLIAIACYVFLRDRRVAIGVLVTGLAAWYTAPIIKNWVDRPRPAALVPGTIIHAGGTAHGLGYPSGHAAVAFAIATVLGPALRRTGRIVVYTVAAVVAVARVYVGAHLPLDVIGGAALGIFIGSLWNIVTRRRRMPGRIADARKPS